MVEFILKETKKKQDSNFTLDNSNSSNFESFKTTKLSGAKSNKNTHHHHKCIEIGVEYSEIIMILSS